MTANHRALDDADITLIERVKETPSLYDPRIPDFRLVYRKEQDWENVSQFVGITALDARRRWTCLRDRYSRELRQLRLHPDSREFGQNQFFRQMDFLRKFVRKRERRRNSLFKIDTSWDGSMDDTKIATDINSDPDENEREEEEEEENLEVVQHDYDVDPSEPFEAFVEPPTEVSNLSDSPKLIPNDSLLPIMLPKPSYALTPPLLSPASPLQTPQHQHYPYQQKQEPQQQQHHQQHPQQPPPLQQQHHLQQPCKMPVETEDDFFCKTIAVYLRQLSRRHKIKAKVEMFQILEKYIELEESPPQNDTFVQKG